MRDTKRDQSPYCYGSHRRQFLMRIVSLIALCVHSFGKSLSSVHIACSSTDCLYLFFLQLMGL